MQFKCSTSAKSVTPQCKLHIVILDNDWLKDNGKFSMPMISCKTIMTKILSGNFEKNFLECEKMASRKIFWHFLHTIFFIFILLISNHMFFLIQFGINLHVFVLQKAKIALEEVAHAIFNSLKNSLEQINSNES